MPGLANFGRFRCLDWGSVRESAKSCQNAATRGSRGGVFSPPVEPAYFDPVPLRTYALLDSGHGEKLERFGDMTLRRPDPQALWRPRLPESQWDKADASFERDPDSGGRGGRWRPHVKAPRAMRGERPEWRIDILGGTFWIRPAAFKHVGLFPEQATNWRYLQLLRKEFGASPPRLLNLFGYSGAASVLAAQAGYEVTHVDASKQAIRWAAENAEASGLPQRSMRVLCDDALGFVQREGRRKSRYDVILLDPPHFGRGPKGEKWQLEDGLAPLLESVRAIVSERALVILSTYAVGYSPLAFRNLFTDWGTGEVAVGELVLREREHTGGDGAGSVAPRLLPAGFCARWGRELPLLLESDPSRSLESDS
ncbi:MAG: 23S rRNA (cytosine1962-C5)-methyltransferase [Planctomycetota bacterium]|jgi:23S rRNA (cytosine1962-C5)-methyltransferase